MSSGVAIQGLDVEENQITIQGLSAVKENDQWRIGQPSPNGGYTLATTSVQTASKSVTALEKFVSGSNDTIFAISNRMAVRLYISGFLDINDFKQAHYMQVITSKPLGNAYIHATFIIHKIVAGFRIRLVIFNENTLGQDIIMPLNNHYQPI